MFTLKYRYLNNHIIWDILVIMQHTTRTHCECVVVDDNNSKSIIGFTGTLSMGVVSTVTTISNSVETINIGDDRIATVMSRSIKK